MLLDIRNTKRGLGFIHKNNHFSLSYPKNTWKDYPGRDFLFQELATLLTLTGPIVSRSIKSVAYTSPRPYFFDNYMRLMKSSIPESTADYRESAQAVLRRFRNINYSFNGATLSLDYSPDPDNRAVIPLSGGKDSLLTFCVCREIGLDPVPVYIDDGLVKPENRYKRALVSSFSGRFRNPGFVIDNRLELFNDFEYWGVPETCLGYMHMMTGFTFMMLPLVHASSSNMIVLGNQRDFEFKFKSGNKLINPSFDQTSRWQSVQDLMVREMTDGKVSVTSVIRPITNMMIMKVLHSRYPDIARCQFSCDCLTGTRQKRWCHVCTSCAKNFLFLKALDIDPAILGFKRSMFSKEKKALFCLFSNRIDDADEKTPEAREQQLLAFLMAYRNGARGYLMDYFRRFYLKEAIAGEDYLCRKFFRTYPAVLPKKIKSDVYSIYKEELDTVVV